MTRSGIALLLLLGLPASPLASERIALAIREIPEAFRLETTTGTGTVAGLQDASLLVVGTINWPAFSVRDANHVLLTDARGQPLPLVVERSSLFSEFGEIGSLRVAFELPVAALAAGLPRLAWGQEVHARNSLVDRLVIADKDRARLRTFVPQAEDSAGASEPQLASVEIIADSNADRYYLWYLLPVAVLFGLLAARKVRLR